MADLDYLRSMYGSKIYLPTEAGREKCFEDFTARLDSNKLEPVQSSILNIDGLLARMVFDQNTNHEFFVEDNFPIGWMYPHLEPHGLIFKINHMPLAELSDDIVQRDRDYWRKSLEPKIGNWLTDKTSIEAIAAFAKKVFPQHDLKDFTGDPRFVQNEYSCKMFSRERAAIAGLYEWRASHSTNDSE